MRLKTRVVTVLLLCCLLIVVMLFYFILFLEDLQSTEYNNNALIIVPFSEVRAKNETNASLLVKRVRTKLQNMRFNSSAFGRMESVAKHVVRELTRDLQSRAEETETEHVWRMAASWVGARQIIPESAPELGKVIHALQTRRIEFADIAKKGTQLKLMLRLEGGQMCLMKPMRYSRDAIMKGMYAGADRHNGEIAAFHISRLLNLRNAPIVASRVIDVNKEIKRVASPALLSTFISHNNRSDCFYGQCYYCSKSDPVCPDRNGFLETALVLLLPDKYQLQKVRHPWQRTYKNGVRAKWELDDNYCGSVLKKLPLRPRLLDLIDVSIFDFLIGNADRHHYEVLKDIPNSQVLLLDNGKSFGDPFQSEITIVYPLSQCCAIRKSTYERIIMLNLISLSDSLSEILNNDIMAPLLTSQHLLALNERIKTILAIIHICFENNTKNEVLK